MSLIMIRKSVGDSTLPCGSPLSWFWLLAAWSNLEGANHTRAANYYILLTLSHAFFVFLIDVTQALAKVTFFGSPEIKPYVGVILVENIKLNNLASFTLTWTSH